MEPALLWLAITVMGMDGAHKICHGANIILVAGTVMDEVGDHEIFHAPANHNCGWLARLWSRLGQLEYFRKPALPWLTDTVMDEVMAHYVFHETSITVVGWHG